MSRDFIRQSPRVHPGAGKRDITDLSRRVEELSRAVSSEERPHLSSRFIESADGDTAVTVDLIKEQINGVVHGLGREYRGWHLASINAASMVFEASTTEKASIDTTVYLPLKCTEDCTVKLVVW